MTEHKPDDVAGTIDPNLESPAPRKAGYNKAYYDSKREELLARKRERYASDPELRERLKRDAAQRRQSKRTGPILTFNGEDHQAYRASDLADRVGKCMSTVNFWQKHGTIPETPFRSMGGYRLYTGPMIEAVAKALEANPRPSRGDEEFRQAVIVGWMEAGVRPA
jgi:hypothetical protein